jgi:hypothetical protein
MREVVLIIATDNIGGAEKRMLGFWIYMQVNNKGEIIVEDISNKTIFGRQKSVRALIKKDLFTNMYWFRCRFFLPNKTIFIFTESSLN